MLKPSFTTYACSDIKDSAPFVLPPLTFNTPQSRLFSLARPLLTLNSSSLAPTKQPNPAIFKMSLPQVTPPSFSIQVPSTPSPQPHLPPSIGLGTFSLPSASVANIIHAALRIGYRHIDTAAAYGNEAEIGRALRESQVPREEVWVTSKLYVGMGWFVFILFFLDGEGGARSGVMGDWGSEDSALGTWERKNC